MTLQQFGLSGLTEVIEENLALAAYLADRVRNAPDLELMAPPGLSIVCFRFVGTGSAGLPPSLKLRRTAEALAEAGQACPTRRPKGPLGPWQNPHHAIAATLELVRHALYRHVVAATPNG
jgi:glutamate/tyrosine decarboxylase-like PLP-dependent enzyme